MKGGGVLEFFKQSLFAEECALKKGFLQSLDPRMKVLSFIFLIVSALLAKNILPVFLLYVLCLLLVCVSGISLGFFLKRTWIFIPMFSLFIGFPALFSRLIPGEGIFSFQVGSWDFTITSAGVSTFFLFVLRVTATVSFAVLLNITTRHFELLKVLRIFGIPQVFVMVLGICYRYIFLFIDIVENTYLAIRSRVGIAPHYKTGQQIAGWNIASLWARSCQLNEDVYKSMLSRGYSGQPQVLDDFKIHPRDWLYLAFTGMILICAIRFSR